MKTDILIYDFETLSQAPWSAPVVSLAIARLPIEENGITFPYSKESFEDLVENKIKVYKFDVAEQVEKYNREIEPTCLEWWSKQSPEARVQLAPSDKDISIESLYNIISSFGPSECRYSFSRGVGFDSVIISSILNAQGRRNPVDWWIERDIRSYIDGISNGTIDNRFIPPIKGGVTEGSFHDPKYDVAVDYLRLVYLHNAVMARRLK